MRINKRMLTLSPWMLGLALVVCGGASLSGCSDSQDDDDDLQSSNENNNGDLGNDDAAEGNGQENFVDNDDKSGSKDSADVNSATADPPPTDAPNATLDGAKDNAATPPANAAPPANATPPPATAAKGGGDGSDKAPVPGGRVRYVKEGGVQVVNAPNGSPVMTLEQGDHPVTWEENGFLKLSTGLYVPVDSLSEKGVARPLNANRWAGGSGGGGGGGGGDSDGGGAAPAAAPADAKGAKPAPAAH